MALPSESGSSAPPPFVALGLFLRSTRMRGGDGWSNSMSSHSLLPKEGRNKSKLDHIGMGER
jgi:hypothetical protein